MDTCILIAGRSFEQGNWIRRSGAKELNGRASPVPKGLSRGSSYLSLTHMIAASDLTLAERGLQTPVLAEENNKPVWGPDLIDQVITFILCRPIC
jgi:hypothetical protein